MFKRLLLLFVLLAFQMGFAQSEKPTGKDIFEMITKAGNHLRKMECDKSLYLAKKALSQAHSIKNNVLIAKAYNIIGLNLEEFSDYKKAISFYKEGLKYANATTNDTLKYSLNNNLGNVYCFRKVDFNKGVEHYKKALSYSLIMKDEYEIMYANLNIASAYFAVEEYDKGLPYLNDAEITVRKSDELEAKISLNSLLGSYYTYTNRFAKAERSFKEALRLCGEEKPEFLEGNATEVYGDISRLYSKTREYEKAYFYLDKYNSLKNKSYDEGQAKAVKIAGLSIELDEYKRQMGQIELEKYIQKQNLQQSKIVVVLFIVVFLILLLLLYTLFKNNRFRKKINNELTIANQELKIAKEKAEEASQLKTQFVSTISHELRTPLYGVIGITDMILDEHKELIGSPYLNSLKFSAKYLLSLVNDILQINKIEENKIILESIPFNVSDKINNILSSLQFIANKNKNKLKCEIDPAIPEFLIGDKLRLSQILMNLIGNALKFTKKGKVIVSADLVRVDGKVNYIKFKIKDNGVGIAKDDQDKIFEKFVQVDRKEEDYQGTGLGLSIVKKLVELFGSEIYLESKEGEGTTFTFTIGFEADTIKSNTIISGFEVDLTSSQIFNVLVVEDNKINQMVTKKILEGNNFKCQVVDNGLVAIKLLKKENFDVILMDINMPIINGFDTTRKIREIGILTPIVALTAFSKEEVIDEVISSGMNDIIVKPFEPVKLFQVIANQITKLKNAD
jgi:signal transduction histidine kinase/ActR/RegA family two-component response regulator